MWGLVTTVHLSVHTGHVTPGLQAGPVSRMRKNRVLERDDAGLDPGTGSDLLPTFAGNLFEAQFPHL